jgi:hypothetical protein
MSEQLEHVKHVLDVYVKEGPAHGDEYLFGYVGDLQGPVTVEVLSAALGQAGGSGTARMSRAGCWMLPVTAPTRTSALSRCRSLDQRRTPPT